VRAGRAHDGEAVPALDEFLAAPSSLVAGQENEVVGPRGDFLPLGRPKPDDARAVSVSALAEERREHLGFPAEQVGCEAEEILVRATEDRLNGIRFGPHAPVVPAGPVSKRERTYAGGGGSSTGTPAGRAIRVSRR
jgi:hypothetical protein